MNVGEGSFLHLVYPILFPTDSFAARAEALDKAPWPGLEKVWVRRAIPTDELLRAVGDFLNPPPGAPATTISWQLDGGALKSPRGLGAADNSRWELVLSRRMIELRVEGVQLTLFHLGVGLLTLRVRPASTDMAQWLDLMHHGRYLDRGQSSTLQVSRRVGIDPQTRQPQYQPFFPGAGESASTDGRGRIADMVAFLLSGGRLAGEEPTWWREIFISGQMLPYAALFLQQVPADQQPATLYRIENFFHATQEIHPSPADLAGTTDARLGYAENQSFLFSLDGGAFVAFDAPDTPFFRELLPSHLSGQYFLLFQLVLYQRFILMMLSDDVARRWLLDNSMDDRQREIVFRQTRERLLAFTAQGHFAQVMQRQHHHRCYRRWQEVFQIDALFKEVREEVHDMHEHLLARRNSRLQEGVRRLEMRLKQIAFVLGPPALAVSYLNSAGWAGPVTSALGIAAGLLFGWIAWRSLTRWTE